MAPWVPCPSDKGMSNWICSLRKWVTWICGHSVDIILYSAIFPLTHRTSEHVKVYFPFHSPETSFPTLCYGDNNIPLLISHSVYQADGLLNCTHPSSSPVGEGGWNSHLGKQQALAQEPVSAGEAADAVPCRTRGNLS